MTDRPMPADWALQRALDDAGCNLKLYVPKKYPNNYAIALAFARYIEKHEQPPVDPDRLDMWRIFAASYSENPMQIEAYLGGLFDDSSHFKHALAEYKKIKGERG